MKFSRTYSARATPMPAWPSSLGRPASSIPTARSFSRPRTSWSRPRGVRSRSTCSRKNTAARQACPRDRPRSPRRVCPIGCNARSPTASRSRRFRRDEQFGPERDARQVFNRMAGCWTYWGWRHGYFDSENDARVYYDEMCAMLARQIGAPNSPQWFNTGLHWAYGISGPAQGHWFVDPADGTRKALTRYVYPSPGVGLLHPWNRGRSR